MAAYGHGLVQAACRWSRSRQILDDSALRGPLREQRRAIGQLEVGKVEAWRHRAAHQRVGAVVGDTRAVPGPRRNDDLRLAVAAQPDLACDAPAVEQP